MAEYRTLKTEREIDAYVKHQDAIYEGNVDHQDRSVDIYQMHRAEGAQLKEELKRTGEVRVWWWP